MNNPVSNTRLIQMYEELRLEWVKKHLKSNNGNSESVGAHIQEAFKAGLTEMEKKKRQIDEVFGLSELSFGTSHKVEDFRLLAAQNLQLAIYRSRTQPDPKAKDENPQNMVEQFNSECYWLGCLMALNSPPLHPDWDNHVLGMDAWDVFPRKTAAVSNSESFC
ncbi:uncharacterized protein LOC120742199 isoform X1 [Simochromis diagramma]|uniref:uncharacterized protein LOC120742199 isoform X1 n=1 Tax=Simochromis diagramma TaxID=43689 RepID=UPI001A7EEBDE|nr:uncharacterized protein LOC120742199 isoform X1 [Simochromis diagramma]XP_039901293.1 uncharacterized protein LOC120742199 isoform X1 [Simochromis diagramma]